MFLMNDSPAADWMSIMNVEVSLGRGLQGWQHPGNSDQTMFHGVADKQVRESGEDVVVVEERGLLFWRWLQWATYPDTARRGLQ